MKELKPTNLIAVEVPEDAKDWYIDKFEDTTLWFCTKQLNGKEIDEFIDLAIDKEEDFKILGEVTKKGIQFDVEHYVEKVWSRNKTFYYDYTVIKNEDNITVNNWYTYTPKLSFQSLLQANNVVIPDSKKLLILQKI